MLEGSDNMKLNTRLKELRLAKGISVYKLSKITDISENHIHGIEKGFNQPSIVILDKLLVPLGTNLSEFFNESETVLYPTPIELELIRSFRALDQEKMQAVMQIIKLLGQHS